MPLTAEEKQERADARAAERALAAAEKARVTAKEREEKAAARAAAKAERERVAAEEKAAKAKEREEKRSQPFILKALVELPGTDVYQAALERIRWLWREFDGNLSVSISGGKDSTVVMELAAIVARENGQKLHVQFLDQEAEWAGTRDYIRWMKDNRDDLEIEWFQIPFRMFNAASHDEEWGYLWEPGHPDSWYMRPPEPDSIRVNDYGVDRFKDVLEEINARKGGVHLTGMRAEESPTRRLGMTTRPAYKYATWGAGDPTGKGRFHLMHPIYDWSFRDIWKAIEEHGWKYNRLYDEMHRYGTPMRNMRVSALIHSGAVRSVDQVQEMEPETWEALVRRFPGMNAVAHIGEDSLAEMRLRKPYMFDTWLEYALYLIDNLIKPEHQQTFKDQIEQAKSMLPWMSYDRIAQKMLPSIMKNDYWSDYSFGKWTTTSKQWAERYERDNGPLPVDWAPALEY